MINSQISRPEPLYKYIFSQLRQDIESGKLRSGDAIPATFELAKKFNIANQTAQNALKELNQRGYVVRIPGKGTFVSNNINSKTVALVTGRNMHDEPASTLYSRVAFEAANYLNANGWASKMYIPTIPDDEIKIIDELGLDIREGRIKFIVVVTMSGTLAKWLNSECSVPWVLALETVQEEHQFELLLKAGLPYLIECGYRRVSLMYSTDQGDAKDVADHILPTLPKPLDLQYLKTQNNHPEEGLKAVREHIDPKNCPEVIFVLNDNLCRGTIVGLLAKGLNFPDKIGLLTHANKEIDILSPVPLTRIEYAPIAILHSNIERVFGLLNDKKTQTLANTVSVVKGQSCVNIFAEN